METQGASMPRWINYLATARRVAHEEGINPVTRDMLRYVIWEKTGYPSFFSGDPRETFVAQARAAFRDIAEHRACLKGTLNE